MKNKKKKGFTLVELIVVIAILAILAAIAVPVTMTVLDNANIGKADTEMAGLRDYIENTILASTTTEVDAVKLTAALNVDQAQLTKLANATITITTEGACTIQVTVIDAIKGQPTPKTKEFNLAKKPTAQGKWQIL